MRIDGIYNVMERLVWDTLNKLIEEYPEACKCQECLRDIATFSLNRVPTRYVTSSEGESHLLQKSYDGILEKVIRNAIAVVSREPHRFGRTMTHYAANEILDAIVQKE